MNYIDLTEQQSGDGSGTSNYNELSNQPKINGVTLTGNKTTLDLGIEDARILPDGYTINIATDGSGDFTTIQEALNSLKGKMCCGSVIIRIATGTYTFNNTYMLQSLANYSKLQFIATDANNKPTLKLTFTNGEMMNLYNAGFVEFINLIFQAYNTNTTHPGVTTNDKSVSVNFGCEVVFRDCTFNNFRNAIITNIGGISRLFDCIVNYCTDAISSMSGGRNFISGTLKANGCGTLFYVYNSGYCDTSGVIPAMTNVTNKYNQTVNIITKQGLITGT